MKHDRPNLLLACLFAPLALPIVSTVYAMWTYVSYPGRLLPNHVAVYPNPFRPTETIFVHTTEGLPWAYLCVLFIGLPLYLLARRWHRASYGTSLIAALLACIPPAFIISGEGAFLHWYAWLLPFGIGIALLFVKIAEPFSFSLFQPPEPLAAK